MSIVLIWCDIPIPIRARRTGFWTMVICVFLCAVYGVHVVGPTGVGLRA